MYGGRWVGVLLLIAAVAAAGCGDDKLIAMRDLPDAGNPNPISLDGGEPIRPVDREIVWARVPAASGANTQPQVQGGGGHKVRLRVGEPQVHPVQGGAR